MYWWSLWYLTCFLSQRFPQRLPNQQTIRGQHRISCTSHYRFSHIISFCMHTWELITYELIWHRCCCLSLRQTREERLCEVFGVYGNIVDCRVAGRQPFISPITLIATTPASYPFVHTTPSSGIWWRVSGSSRLQLSIRTLDSSLPASVINPYFLAS